MTLLLTVLPRISIINLLLLREGDGPGFKTIPRISQFPFLLFFFHSIDRAKPVLFIMTMREWLREQRPSQRSLRLSLSLGCYARALKAEYLKDRHHSKCGLSSQAISGHSFFFHFSKASNYDSSKPGSEHCS